MIQYYDGWPEPISSHFDSAASLPFEFASPLRQQEPPVLALCVFFCVLVRSLRVRLSALKQAKGASRGQRLRRYGRQRLISRRLFSLRPDSLQTSCRIIRLFLLLLFGVLCRANDNRWLKCALQCMHARIWINIGGNRAAEMNDDDFSLSIDNVRIAALGIAAHLNSGRERNSLA